MHLLALPLKRLGLSTILLSSVATAALAQTAGEAVNAGEVSANGGGGGGGTGIGTQVPTPTQVFNSGQTVRVLTPDQQQMLGPAAGGAQGLSLAPGAYVNGYGNSGATKYTIALDGIGQGWGGYGGYTGGASLMVTLDGVPIVDPITGLWASSSIPNMQMFQGTTVTYGPGNAANRWYDNIGGQVEFTPLQPTKSASAMVNLTAGSFNDQILNFAINSGEHNGWSTIIEGSFEDGASYRVGPDGFNNPYNDYSLFTKTVKQFDGGDISFGAYYARSAGYRPSTIPTEPNSQIGIFGPSAGPLYSQKTSGFYSSLPYNTYAKFDVNQLWTAYSKFNYAIDDTTAVHNMMYVVREDRLHSRSNDAYQATSGAQFEYNNPYSYWYGDKVSLTKDWWFNTFDTGAFVQNAVYNTSNSFYSPYPPFNGSVNAPNYTYRSGMFTQLDTAVYAQDDIHPIDNLHITPGIRLAMYNTSYTDAGPMNFPGATGANQGALGNNLPYYQTRNYLAPEPSIEVNYQPEKWLALYASIEQGYKTPQVGGGGGLYQAIDSQYAQLSFATEYQVGFKVMTDHPEWYLHNFDFGANYFFNRYAKQTITTTTSQGAASTAFGTSNYQGVNIYADDNPFLQLHTFVNASIVNALYTNYVTGNFGSPVSYSGSHVPYVPTSTLNLGADYKFLAADGITVDPYVLFQFSGSQYIFNNGNGTNINPHPSSQQLSSYGTMNLGVNATVPVTVYGKDRDINLSLSVLNVTNNRYNNYLFLSSGGYYGTTNSGYGLGYPAPPLTVYGSVGVSF